MDKLHPAHWTDRFLDWAEVQSDIRAVVLTGSKSMALFQRLAGGAAEQWQYAYPAGQVEQVVERVRVCHLEEC